ncbi:hypothetical protein CPLU01_00999 [Colletotrichum plurivorum]|uniref:CENP-T/Histone H4 histone fold domain-containing protein n=1 Tax=Colletotrichum plurivorum TaxID=2175906 RepID=A0A8H6U4G8_9PEZI|nr:hypothetical protein CPLU01_00999 [Colletotrichum plurivorum]
MSFNTPTNARGSFLDDDDPLFSSALMDTTTGRLNRTPDARRAAALDPPSSRQSFQTPSNPAANPLRSSLRSSAYRNPATPGLSASGRRSIAATPHARAAYRTIDQRRAAALTPGGKKRRESLRPRRESLRDVLRGLSRVTKHNTDVVVTSSSPSDVGGPALPIRTVPRAPDRSLMYDDDEDDELPIDRPRLSLPLDVEEEDDDLVPPRLSEMDENATIEFPRRAYPNQSRLSMGEGRLSGYRNFGELDDDDDDDGGVGFDPGLDVGPFDDEEGREQDASLERIENDAARRETLASARESDFGFQVPLDGDQTTFIMAVEGQSSPARPLPEITDEQPSVNIGPLPDDQNPLPPFDSDDRDDNPGGGFEDFGPTYDMRSSSPEDYTAATMAQADITDFAGADADATEEEAEGDASQAAEQQRRGGKPSKRGLKLSRYNIEYPSLPPAVVKRLAGTFARSSGVTKTKISPEVLAEIQRASDWFFEQLGDDLAAYAKHAKRKTIDESDMLTLMRRQRQTSSTTTPFSLAQRHLPRELLQELRMPKPAPPPEPRKKKRRAADGDGEDGEDVT